MIRTLERTVSPHVLLCMRPSSFVGVFAAGVAVAMLPSGSFAQSLNLALLPTYDTSYTVWVNNTGATSQNVYATMQPLAATNQSPGLNLPAT
ncbi:MAG TPA: hypothetical protein VMT32_03905, partial [Bryobacteraceae bacterium]|nr:hypothetical protein [Bryobacteraceae bacterium]